MASQSETLLPGERGKPDHDMRERIVAVAHDMFRSAGLSGTSVADIAADLGVTPAYIYRFFSSKVAIAEAVCRYTLSNIDTAIWALAQSDLPPPERLKRLYFLILKESVGMFFAERKLHELVSTALDRDWTSVAQHKGEIRAVVARIIDDGRASGAFDPKLDRDEAILAVSWSLFPFAHPRMLEQSIGDDLEAQARVAALFALRALECRASSK